jgi:chromosome segregation ATPase
MADEAPRGDAARDAGDAPDAAELQGLLDEARAEVERLEREAADASSRAYRAASEAGELRTALDHANARLTGATAEADGLRAQIDQAEARERESAVRYRELMLRAEPSLPAEMVAGETIDAVDASVVAARDVVSCVRSHIEAQTTASRVPAGAPQRGGIDTGAMSPQQKIRYGLEQRTQT